MALNLTASITRRAAKPVLPRTEHQPDVMSVAVVVDQTASQGCWQRWICWDWTWGLWLCLFVCPQAPTHPSGLSPRGLPWSHHCLVHLSWDIIASPSLLLWQFDPQLCPPFSRHPERVGSTSILVPIRSMVPGTLKSFQKSSLSDWRRKASKAKREW